MTLFYFLYNFFVSRLHLCLFRKKDGLEERMGRVKGLFRGPGLSGTVIVTRLLNESSCMQLVLSRDFGIMDNLYGP